MRAVNLLPREIAPERPSYKQMLPYLGACSVPLLTASFIFIGYTSAQADATTLLGQVPIDIATREAGDTARNQPE